MRAPKPTTRANIERLRQMLWAAGTQASEEEQVRLLNEVAETEGRHAVPVLTNALLKRTGLVALVAAHRIDEIARRSTGLELAELDWRVREAGGWDWSLAPATETIEIARGLTGTLGVISFYRSGYVREAVVHALASVYDGSELPFLLIRANDWVDPVRSAAKEAVFDRRYIDYAQHFIRQLPLVFRLREQAREDHRALTDAILGLLRGPECREVLRGGVTQSDGRSSLLAFGLLLETTGNRSEAIRDAVELGLASAHPMIRLRAAQMARERLEGASLEQALARMMLDRTMSVRREGLRGYAERLQQERRAREVLENALLDAHATMREVARFYVRKVGRIDVAEFYRAQFHGAGGKAVEAAIAGLGETGSGVEDAKRVVPFLADAKPRVRRAAMRAVGRLGADEHVEAFIAALGDRSAGVAKTARDVLRARLHLVSPERIWLAFAEAREAHTRRVALSLIGELGWWDSAPMLLDATACGDEASRLVALKYLYQWRGNTGRLLSRPRVDQLALLERRMHEHGHRLPEELRSDFAFHVSYARRELL